MSSRSTEALNVKFSLNQPRLERCYTMARVNSAGPAPLDEATIIRALQASKAEEAAGRVPESEQLLANVAQRAPNHPAVLNELGVRMLARGAADQAQLLFSRAATANPSQPSIWANLASSLKALGRRLEEFDAIEKALALEPRHLSALLQKADYLEQAGRSAQCRASLPSRARFSASRPARSSASQIRVRDCQNQGGRRSRGVERGARKIAGGNSRGSSAVRRSGASMPVWTS